MAVEERVSKQQIASVHLNEYNLRGKSYLLLGAGCLLFVMAAIVGIADNPPGIVSMLLGVFVLALGIV